MSSLVADSSAPVNHWPDDRCAKAFWTQRELPPYKQLLQDTADWLDPKAGERWIDLGCGGGQLTRTVWEKSGGTVAEIVSLDCAAANEKAIGKLIGHLNPPATADRVHFLHADFSSGLAAIPEGSFDGAVSGLAIQYAESYSASEGRWTGVAYQQLLRDIQRILKPGGRFVFSVNVPEPAWVKIALYGVPGFFTSRKPLRYVKNAFRMLRYGSWLKREARQGRFHYLPATTLVNNLKTAGFSDIESRLSFARQAYVVRCRRPA